MAGVIGNATRPTLGNHGRLSEFGSVLTLLGLLNPLGPLGVIGSMATVKAHWGKPIWVTEGGPELPVTNSTIALALMLLGPGKYSLDKALGIRLPRWIAPPRISGYSHRGRHRRNG